MVEYETFVYLDVKKTGTTFIKSFLKEFSRETPLRNYLHRGMAADCDRSKYYFISVRNPLDQYVSLYSHGCRGLGQLAWRLNKKGRGGFYDRSWSGFGAWLDFVLDPENAGFLGDDYGTWKCGRLREFVGLQGYRVLRLSIPDATRVLAKCDSKEAVAAAYNAQKLPNFTIRMESLRPDLKELVLKQLPDRFADPSAAIRFIETEPPINSSPRVDRLESNPTLDSALQRRLEEREWLIYDAFGY